MGTSIEHASGDPQLAERAMSEALLAVRAQRGELSPIVHSLSEAEQHEGVALANIYERFIGLWPASAVEFSPPIAGANIVASCRADLSIGTALYEIKTVSRNFQSPRHSPVADLPSASGSDRRTSLAVRRSIQPQRGSILSVQR